MIFLKVISTCLFVILISRSALALAPAEVMVIANINVPESRHLARYYMEKRQIPQKNLLHISITDKETCTRREYEEKALPPVRKFLKNNTAIRAIVSMYGIPLRIKSPGNTKAENDKLEQFLKDKTALEKKLTLLQQTKTDTRKLTDKISDLQKSLNNYKKFIDKTASFDSELSLVKKAVYDLNMWLPNPYYIGYRDKELDIGKQDVMMTSRLDGANQTVVKRVIDDTIEAEKNGLAGKACFDARWKQPDTGKKVSGYAFYDRSIHLAAQNLTNKNRMAVVLNEEQELFQKGERLNAAIYCGWYSLASYIDAFVWAKGSVGYHIASSECTTLKRKDANVWCKKMLDNGIAATIGPVGEPYVQAFPVPEIFFEFLTEGYLSLAEAYIVSLPYISWKMVLVGDPLYKLNLISNQH